MAQVWLRARQDFTHAGRSYTMGQLFQAPTLVAVQMRASRSVEFAKAPIDREGMVKPLGMAKPVEPIVTTTRRRRVVAPKEPDAPPVAETPAPEPEPEPVTSQTAEATDLDLGPGTYARKDLRAED